MIRPLCEGTTYPQFHLHGKRLNSHTLFKLHIDRVNPWSSKNSDHSQEYDRKDIIGEIKRIKNLLL